MSEAFHRPLAFMDLGETVDQLEHSFGRPAVEAAATEALKHGRFVADPVSATHVLPGVLEGVERDLEEAEAALSMHDGHVMVDYGFGESRVSFPAVVLSNEQAERLRWRTRVLAAERDVFRRVIEDFKQRQAADRAKQQASRDRAEAMLRARAAAVR